MLSEPFQILSLFSSMFFLSAISLGKNWGLHDYSIKFYSILKIVYLWMEWVNRSMPSHLLKPTLSVSLRLLQTLESHLLRLYCDNVMLLHPSDLQLLISSTNYCSWLVRQSAMYHLINKSRGFSCFWQRYQRCCRHRKKKKKPVSKSKGSDFPELCSNCLACINENLSESCFCLSDFPPKWLNCLREFASHVHWHILYKSGLNQLS